MAPPPAKDTPKPSNFLRTIIERDLEAGLHQGRPWGGSPGDAAHHAAGAVDPARIRTRFPPEPNGYLHVGHAKSICLNFGFAQDYGGICHLRFDDTNPEKEEQEFVDAIIEMVHWLGFDWNVGGTSHLYYASNYFDFMYRAAEALVGAGLAYVDEQGAEEMRANRGDFNTPGTPSPFRARTPAENLARLREMRDGRHADGAMVLRAKIDLASPNINLRDPTLYRIKRAHHHNTGDRWCIYPMYTYAHPIEDALERVTHSFCTLEFEDQRPFYDWLLENLVTLGLLSHPLPRQYEFGRLNLTSVMTSKRKLKSMVDEGIVSGWDDPRMPTLAGMRRRGYTPASIRRMAADTGASKTNIWIDYSVLDIALRDDQEGQAARAMAVLDPVPLTLTNWAEVFGERSAPGTLPGAGAPAAPGAGPAPLRAGSAGVDRTRRLRRSAREGLLPPVPGQQGAPEVRHGRRVHRLREGRARHRGRGAGARGARHQERHARRRRGEGQGHHHLGGAARRAARRSAPVRAPVRHRPARGRRPRLPREPEPAQPQGRDGATRTVAGRRGGGHPAAVRTSRLLRGRPARPPGRTAGVQPHHRAEGLAPALRPARPAGTGAGASAVARGRAPIDAEDLAR
jgi:glutamyl/glutaminyl-tRNA synthetase